MTISLAAVAAQRANAVYIEDESASKAAFSSIGDDWIAMYKNDSHQAVLSTRSDGVAYLSISGTRVSPLSLDVFEDVSLEPVKMNSGGFTKGVLDGMNDLWKWAISTAPLHSEFSVCGHSLGASRTHLTPLFLPPYQIGKMFSFEAPKFCDAAYYAAYQKELESMMCFLNGADLWAGWPWVDARWNARPLQSHVWLKGDEGQFQMIDGLKWPGGFSVEDHEMERVMNRVIALDKTLFKQG
jgi:hypothetical protein